MLRAQAADDMFHAIPDLFGSVCAHVRFQFVYAHSGCTGDIFLFELFQGSGRDRNISVIEITLVSVIVCAQLSFELRNVVCWRQVFVSDLHFFVECVFSELGFVRRMYGTWHGHSWADVVFQLRSSRDPAFCLTS